VGGLALGEMRLGMNREEVVLTETAAGLLSSDSYTSFSIVADNFIGQLT